MRAILCIFLIAAFADVGFGNLAWAANSAGIQCARASSKVERTICTDQKLLSADRWLAQVYQQRQGAGTSEERDSLSTSQRQWIKRRDDCIKRDDPNRVRAYLGTMADCLHSSYYRRIQTLEKPLRRFVDLKDQAPRARNVCEAMHYLNRGERWRLVLRQALIEEDVRLSNEDDGPKYRRRIILNPALDAAAEADGGNYLMEDRWDGDVSRVQLFPGQPPNWILTFYAGSLSNPKIFIFGSTPDGRQANRFIGSIGEEGSGYFDTHYVRFQDEPYAAITTEDRPGFSLLTLTGKSVDCRASAIRR